MKNIEKKYLVVYDKNPNSTSNTNQFETYMISEGEFVRDQLEDFRTKKKWSLEKNIRIFYLEIKEPVVKIIPEVKVTFKKQRQKLNKSI